MSWQTCKQLTYFLSMCHLNADDIGGLFFVVVFKFMLVFSICFCAYAAHKMRVQNLSLLAFPWVRVNKTLVFYIRNWWNVMCLSEDAQYRMMWRQMADDHFGRRRSAPPWRRGNKEPWVGWAQCSDLLRNAPVTPVWLPDTKGHAHPLSPLANQRSTLIWTLPHPTTSHAVSQNEDSHPPACTPSWASEVSSFTVSREPLRRLPPPSPHPPSPHTSPRLHGITSIWPTFRPHSVSSCIYMLFFCRTSNCPYSQSSVCITPMLSCHRLTPNSLSFSATYSASTLPTPTIGGLRVKYHPMLSFMSPNTFFFLHLHYGKA